MGLNPMNLRWQFVSNAHLYAAFAVTMAATLMIVLREYLIIELSEVSVGTSYCDQG
jgi:hypothetical protein